MARQDMLIDAVVQMFARQSGMLNIVDQFQLLDCNKSRKSKEQPPCKTANAKSQNYKASLQYNISQQRILWIEKPVLGTAQHGPLHAYCRKKHCVRTLGKNL